MDVKAKALLNYMQDQLESLLFMLMYRSAPQYFTRETESLNFRNTALIILKLVKKSAKAELMDFFYNVVKKLAVPSRQAFAEAREKINYQAFKDFFDKSCELAVNDADAKLYKGFRIFAVDGTSFLVGALSKLAEYFGESTTVAGEAMCRLSAVVDVLGDYIVNACVSPFSVGERALAIKQIAELSFVSNALYLFDRGYWSPALTAKIISNGQKFIMRLASNAGRTSITDENGNKCALRRFSLTLPDGKRKVLLTNLSEAEMSDDELVALYAKRWGVETKYLELKARLEIDRFSGNSVNIVLQDIYSTLFISNLVAFICCNSDNIIKERTAHKNNKYQQKTNRTLCIATLRQRFIELCLANDPLAMDFLLKRFYDDISKSVCYVRKSKPRPRNSRKLKESRRHFPKPLL